MLSLTDNRQIPHQIAAVFSTKSAQPVARGIATEPKFSEDRFDRQVVVSYILLGLSDLRLSASHRPLTPVTAIAPPVLARNTMVELSEKLPAQRGRSLLGVPPQDLILRVRGGQHGGYVVRLSDLKCTIGSHERCTLRLRAAGVKPWHCLVFRGSQATFVRRIDENTRLNGRTFDVAALSAGDRLTVGPVELEVIDERVARRQPSPSHTAALPRHWYGPSECVRAAAEQARRQAGQLKATLAKTRHAATRRVRQLAEQLRSAREQIRRLHDESERSHEDSATARESLVREQELLAVEFERRKSELEAEMEQRGQQLEARAAVLSQQEQEFAITRAATEKEFDARQQELAEQHEQIQREQSRTEQEILQARREVHSSSEQLECQKQELQRARTAWEQQRRGQEEQLLERAELLKRRRAELAEGEAEIEAARAELENLRTELEQLRAATAKLQPPPHEDSDPVQPAYDPVPLTPGDETVSDVLGRMGQTVDEDGPADGPIAPPSAVESNPEPVQAPLPIVPKAPAQSPSLNQPAEYAGVGGKHEETVEEYMARLMQRLRGGQGTNQAAPLSTVLSTVPEAVADVPAPAPVAETQTATVEVEPPAPGEEPAETPEYRPRNLAPERGADLGALRDLANSSARSAISSHKVKMDGKAAVRKAIATVAALVGTVALVYWLGCSGPLALAGTGIALLLSLIWGAQTLVLTWRTLQARSISKQVYVEPRRASGGPADAPVAAE
jgi:hypothetical protein